MKSIRIKDQVIQVDEPMGDHELIWCKETQQEIEQLKMDNDNLLKFIEDNYGGCPYDYNDEIVRLGECTKPDKECGYSDNIGPCWMIYITRKIEG